MLRTLRRYSQPALALLAATGLGFGVATAPGADSSFEPGSTLDAQIAPHDLSIDATIASMVRRGLLADVAQPPQAQPAPAGQAAGSAGPRLTAPVVAPRAAVPQASGWRPQGTSSLPLGAGASSGIRSTLPALSTPMGPAPSAPVLAPPTARAAATPEAPAEPALQFPDLPTEDELSSELTGGAAAPRVAARPAADLAAPPTSDDPLPEDSLEPIDALPETPAPANDAPGDPREPEIGDEDLEGSLAPQGNAAPGGAPAPGSLSGRSLTPVGEPDRIEEADESISPPSNPEM
ncbi:MAG TPA: hypothetical protein VEQ85_07570, partial [Lacipirellulaceae bacterium]|nr:hypothetical protein [Lacipirellulaceae bacterium]